MQFMYDDFSKCLPFVDLAQPFNSLPDKDSALVLSYNLNFQVMAFSLPINVSW